MLGDGNLSAGAYNLPTFSHQGNFRVPHFDPLRYALYTRWGYPFDAESG